MPKLPDKTILGPPPSGDAGRRMMQLETPRVADYEVAGALARGVGDFAGALKVRFEKADDYEVQKALVDFDLQQEKRLDDAKREADPDARDFTVKYRGGYDQGATEFMKGVPRHLREKVDTALVKRGAMFEKRAYDFELAQRDKFHIDDVNTKAQDFLNETTAKPEAFIENAERGRALIRASRLPAATKLKLEKQFLEQNEALAIEAMLDRAKANGDDLTELRERVRKVPRGQLIAPNELAPEDRPTFEGRGGPAPIRFNNPGAMYPGPSATKFGSIRTETIGGGHKIAVFPDAVSGAAAQFDLFMRKYTGRPLRDSIREWSGGNSSPQYAERVAREIGIDATAPITREMMMDPAVAVPLAKAMAKWESGMDYPLEEDQWLAAHAWAVGKPRKKASSPPEIKSGPQDAEAPETPADAPKDASVVDDLAEDENAEFKHLSSKKRRALLHKIDTDQRGIAKQIVDGEIAKIRRGEMPVTNAFDRALPQLTHQQRIEAQSRMKRARVYADTTRKLNDMSDSDMDDAVARLAVGPDTPPEEAAWMDKAHGEALAHARRIKELRQSDPVAALEGNIERRIRPAREIAEARLKTRSMLGIQAGIGTDEQGNPVAYQQAVPADGKKGRDSWKLTFDARVDAQRRTNPDGEIRYLTKKEAEKLLEMPVGITKVTDRGFHTALRAAADRAHKLYPPEYADKALRDAIKWKIKGEQEKATAIGIATKLAKGEPVRESDLRSWRMQDELDREALFPYMMLDRKEVVPQRGLDAERPAIMSSPPVVETPKASDPGVGRVMERDGMFGLGGQKPKVKAGAPTPTLTPDAKPRAGTTRQTTVPAISGKPDPTPEVKPAASTQASPKLPGKVDPNNPFAKRLREREEVR